MITLVLGGARSGKSALAESMAPGSGVTYIATGAARDPDMAARIEAHRARRPPGWVTVESGADLPAAVRASPGFLVVDSLTTWVADAPHFSVAVGDFCAALAERNDDSVVVSDEVGMGVHPSSESGRSFRDALGKVNQAVAEMASDVVLVVAGRVLRLERPSAVVRALGPPGSGGSRDA